MLKYTEVFLLLNTSGDLEIPEPQSHSATWDWSGEGPLLWPDTCLPLGTPISPWPSHCLPGPCRPLTLHPYSVEPLLCTTTLLASRILGHKSLLGSLSTPGRSTSWQENEPCPGNS